MLTSDWHIHTRNSCDCRKGPIAETFAETVAAARACGVEDFGVSDHIHTPFNLPDLEASRADFVALPASPRFHFGVEVSCVSRWELDEIARGAAQAPVYGVRKGGPAGGELAIGVTRADLARLGVEYVIGGTHWPLYVPYERETIIRDYHRQNLFLACHPLVTIVAHPWWWMGHWKDAAGMYLAEPWFDRFAVIPQSLHDEFASAARENRKLVEVNLRAMLLSPSYPDRFKREYCEYLAGLKTAGVRLSLGSDHHAQSLRCGVGMDQAEAMLAAVGICDADFWRLPPRPATASDQAPGGRARHG